MPFEFHPGKLSGVTLISPRAFPDNRGSFWETFKESDFRVAGISDRFVQDNHSLSHSNVVRGLHYQNPPHAQAKLVRCLVGQIYDVVVDIRMDSPTFGQWEGYSLSAENRNVLYVPEGFAHGFAVQSHSAEITYKVSREYHASSEAGVAWDDPNLGIQWPKGASLVSEKDRILPNLKDADIGFHFD